MKGKILVLCLIIFTLSDKIFAQIPAPFTVELETLNISGIPALHSFANATWQDKWLLIGGRDNGLHGFLPPLSFPNSGQNANLTVLDPQTGTVVQYPVSSLPDSIKEPLQTSNMTFFQDSNLLIIVGGYGYSDTAGYYLTHPALLIIDVPAVIQAIENGQNPASSIFRITDQRMAVCGAHLIKRGSTYSIVFGHRFDGTYDTSDTTGFFVQNYTYAIRNFELFFDGDSLAIDNYSEIIDSSYFRRRDYNLVPQIFEDGSFGYTAYSGVFRPDENLPYLFPVDLRDTGYLVIDTFNQYLSNYHSAVMPVYNSADQELYTYFFGGMAYHYFDTLTQTVVEDSLIPFVNTVSYIERASDGSLREYLSGSMPDLLGTNAQFILKSDAPLSAPGIVDYQAIQGRTLVGYIYGGIMSPDRNISQTDPSLSEAVNTIYKVYINPDGPSAIRDIEVKGLGFSVELLPNPSSGKFILNYFSKNAGNLGITLFTVLGEKVCEKSEIIQAGSGVFPIELNNPETGIYFIKCSIGNQSITKKIVIE
jgi:hypothetical protein